MSVKIQSGRSSGALREQAAESLLRSQVAILAARVASAIDSQTTARRAMKTRSIVALSREQLYRRVWSQPLSAVAKEVGVSGNALAKICSRLLVPHPSRGHWARIGGGKTLARPPLPAAPETQTRRITISRVRAATRRTRTRLQPAERREQLIEVAKEIIVKEGLHAASMKRIAAQAGVSETQAYNYFGSREKLFVALARSELSSIQEAQKSDIAQ